MIRSQRRSRSAPRCPFLARPSLISNKQAPTNGSLPGDLDQQDAAELTAQANLAGVASARTGGLHLCRGREEGASRPRGCCSTRETLQWSDLGTRICHRHARHACRQLARCHHGSGGRSTGHGDVCSRMRCALLYRSVLIASCMCCSDPHTVGAHNPSAAFMRSLRMFRSENSANLQLAAAWIDTDPARCRLTDWR